MSTGFINEQQAGTARQHGTVASSRISKRWIIKGNKEPAEVKDRAFFKEADRKALAAIMNEDVVTAPRKGRFERLRHKRADEHGQRHRLRQPGDSLNTSFADAEMISGEYVRENILTDDPTCHACPVALKKEFEIHEGKYQVRARESYEYSRRGRWVQLRHRQHGRRRLHDHRLQPLAWIPSRWATSCR